MTTIRFNFSTMRHWAHRKRADGHRTPVEVLGWLKGRRAESDRLRQLFRRAEFLRTVNGYGFVSVQRFYIYAESGLSRQRVLIWIYEGELSIEYQQTLVARYRCDYDLKHKQLQGLSDPTLYTTRFTPPQLELIELDDAQWVKFQQRPARTYSKRIAMLPKQLPLIDLGVSALILLVLKTGLPTFIGDDVNRMREAARQNLGLFTTLPFFQRLFRVSGFEEEAAQMEQGQAGPESLTERLLDAVCLLGSLERCQDQLSAFRGSGVDMPILMPPLGVESARAVIQAFRR